MVGTVSDCYQELLTLNTACLRMATTNPGIRPGSQAVPLGAACVISCRDCK